MYNCHLGSSPVDMLKPTVPSTSSFSNGSLQKITKWKGTTDYKTGMDQKIKDSVQNEIKDILHQDSAVLFTTN